jgi:polyisoprenyl-phosphate glycosyltransferase
MLYSLIVPVYRNEADIPALLEAVAWLNQRLDGQMEAVFVVDGSPDLSYQVLSTELSGQPFDSQLLLHSRNFGSFAAIRTGIAHARGAYFANMAADLQDPPELILELFAALTSEEFEVAVGTRSSRADPLTTRLTSGMFWRMYRRFVLPELPRGGVDVFACTRAVADVLLSMEEAHSNLVALVFWSGFRRTSIAYDRRPRMRGASGWSFKKKVRYFADSVFSSTDLPVRTLWFTGSVGLVAAGLLALAVLAARLSGQISVPGYSATVLTVVFFASLNLLGLGIIGSYVWRAYENTKARPGAIVMRSDTYEAKAPD